MISRVPRAPVVILFLSFVPSCLCERKLLFSSFGHIRADDVLAGGPALDALEDRLDALGGAVDVDPGFAQARRRDVDHQDIVALRGLIVSRLHALLVDALQMQLGLVAAADEGRVPVADDLLLAAARARDRGDGLVQAFLRLALEGGHHAVELPVHLEAFLLHHRRARHGLAESLRGHGHRGPVAGAAGELNVKQYY